MTEYKFYTILITKDMQILHNPFALTHKDLICRYITYENEIENNFIRAYYSPKNNHRLDDLDNYELLINELTPPDWVNNFDFDLLNNKLREIVEGMIINTRKTILLNEGAILTKNALICETKNSVIFGMYDNSIIKSLGRNSEIYLITDKSTIYDMIENSEIHKATKFTKIGKMSGYSKIHHLNGYSSIDKMMDNSKVILLKGDAFVSEMHELSSTERTAHLSKIFEMRDSSTVCEMRDNSIIAKMFDNSKIFNMYNNAVVVEMYGSSTIGNMSDNSSVGKQFENSSVN